MEIDNFIGRLRLADGHNFTMTGGQMQILVIDDHPLIRKGLISIIREEMTHALIDEATDAASALAQVKRQGFAVVVLDLNLPGRNGFDLMKDLRAWRPGLRILILSVHNERQYALRALKSGAYGYLCKDAAAEELVHAIQRIAAGHKYVTEAVAEALAFDVADKDGRNKPPHELLSNREFETLLLIASGKTVSEIADQLNLSVKTISTYRTRILEKMNLHTNAELTRYAFEQDLITTLR